MPDLEVVSKGQCFPRYRYERIIGPSASRESVPTSPSRSLSPTTCPNITSSKTASASQDGPTSNQGGTFDDSGAGVLFASELERVDNITDSALSSFRDQYCDLDISKDSIFDYVYGVLHAPAYRERFANDLSKALPRIPFAPDFWAFADAGRELAALHLGYESCPEHPLEVELLSPGPLQAEHFRIGTRKMRYADDGKTVLIVNDYIRITDIPHEAHEYIVNGRTPIEWFVDRYRVTQDKQSGITNDPNAWFERPEDLITAFCRIVHVSVETARIIEGLPEPFTD